MHCVGMSQQTRIIYTINSVGIEVINIMGNNSLHTPEYTSMGEYGGVLIMINNICLTNYNSIVCVQ